MKIALITSCASRKRDLRGTITSTSLLKKGTFKEVANNWNKLIKTNAVRTQASNLYLGRGTQEIKKSAKILKADLWFVSAGMGFISENQQIPAYDLTVSRKSPSFIGNKINTQEFNVTEWWNAIDNGQFEREIQKIINDYELIILAMPTNYFNMISTELENLSEIQLSKMRIIGPITNSIQQKFHSLLMPYDYRLDGPDSPIRGTRSDFAQRATHHFAKFVVGKLPTGNAHSHTKLVLDRLNKMTLPSKIIREKKSDGEIIAIIIENWSACRGRSAESLRMLRDKNLVSCEQRRFSRLFNQLKSH